MRGTNMSRRCWRPSLLTPDQVTAVIVTRGDVDLKPVLDSLIFDSVEIYDNSVEANWMTYGRVLAANRAECNVIYSQDDDIIHTPENQLAIIQAYEPGVLTGCMWPEWSDGAKVQGIERGYDDLVFCGSGSVYDKEIPYHAANQYLDHFSQDSFFRLWADTIVGVIASTKQLDIRFDALPCAEDDNRMCNLPDAVHNKTEAINRARWVRDEKWVRAIA